MSPWYADSHRCQPSAQVQYQNAQVLPWIYLWPELRVLCKADLLILGILLLGLKVK